MEDPLATAPAPPPRRHHRERRHRRKASDAAAAALAAASSYDDVFGGPPRFAPPPPAFAAAGTTAPADYAEVFGGVAASCSIPYLDLPPAVASGDGAGAGAGGYGEIFGRFDFGDFAVPYEDMLPGAESLLEEIASPSGSSRSSTRKESAQLDAEPSILYQQVPDAGSGRHFDDEQFHPVSFPPDGEQTFTMSYNKTTRGRPDDLFEMTACIVEPSISYVVDSCNLSNDSEMDYVPEMDSGTHANGVKEKMSPPNVADSSLESADSAYVVDQQQHIPTCPPISENICQDENDNKRSSTDSVPSEEAPSPDYPFLRVSNVSLPAAPIKVQPPLMPPSKLLNKRGSNENGDSDVNRNSVAAAAAMKEAMEFAEARLKAAKELMERKGGSFKFRKRPAHHRSTKSTEIKECNAPEEVHLFEEKLNMRRLAKEGNQSNDIALLDKNMGSGSIKPVHSDHDKQGIILPRKPQEMMQNGSDLEQLGEWTSDADFYELVSNDQKCGTNEDACKGDNGLMTNSLAKLERSENEKSRGFAGESKRFRKLWDCNNTTCLRTEHANQGKDGIDSVEAEQKTPRYPEVTEHVNQGKDGIDSVEAEQKSPRLPEVTPCDERVTYQEPTKENNGLMTNSSTKLDQSEKVKEGGFAGEPKRFRKLWGSNSTTVLRTEHVNLGKYGIAFVEAEEKAPRFPEVPRDERVASQEATDSHLKQCPGVGNFLGHENDAQFEISCMNNLPAGVHADPEISSTFLEPCLSAGHANGNENHSESTAQETPLVGNSNQDVNSKEELQLPCIDGLPCTSARTQILQDHSNVINADEIKEIEAKTPKLEEPSKSYLNFEEERLLSFVDESRLQNKNGRANEVNSESLIHEKMTKFGIEEKADAHEDFQEGDMDQVAGSAEEEGYVTSGSGIANESEYEEAETDIIVGDMKSNVRTCGSFDKDPYQCQESQGSWGPQDLDNRMDRFSDTISHGKDRETKECLLDNVEKTVAEVLNHDSREGQKSMETVVYMKPKDACAEFNVSSDRDGNLFDSADELITDDGSDYAMKMSTMSKNLQASFSEACCSMQHLSQKPESVSAEKADESTPVLENLEVDCREAGREIPTKNCTESEEGQNIGSEIEEREREDNISNVRFMDQQPFYLDSDIRHKAAEDTASETILKSREENLNVQRTKVRNDIKEAEGEVEKEVRLDEEKEKECKMGKVKEQDKERRRRELEEEKEWEMERAKDRLAVQRATREAHERAFAEVRAKAERMALERITSARQRASAEAHEKEEKATAQAALEQASREARMKAERAAVERATAEARERAIEKAKAAADAKERMGKFRSSFKDSFKAPNQDNQQEASFQKATYNKHGKSMDSCVEVEVESALRHKAKLERHQRTAERAAKALAEKNMQDMLAQREQAEKHRLAEFLDPEVKRWSNGKEGNLRALLSTLQYILGSDSGWQSVPLTDLITAAGVKKAYRKATLCVHPDKVQQRGATIRQKYICEKVFDLLKEAWNKYNSEER
ncbi:auxilin-like protein 1 isoform X2 [Miscanthus floridulus]|uniref:auxilin-like protein 1 isoform X2 n=1 Tax=Miscanthus floridulus TaxID=154761 RepID=UPI00345A4F4D